MPPHVPTIPDIIVTEHARFRRELNSIRRGYRDTHMNHCLDEMTKRLLQRIKNKKLSTPPSPALDE